MKNFILISMIMMLSWGVIGCSTSIPLNPETNEALVPDIEKLDHDQQVEMQKEVIHMQEKEKAKQEKEMLELRKQEYYNYRAERFKTK